jgi:hypothetical protein
MISPQRILSAITVAAPVAIAAAFVGGASGSAPASHAPVICPRLDTAFRLEFGAWGGPGTSLPRRELFAAAVTRGSDELGGHMIYGSATPTKATADPACRPTRLASRPIDSRLLRPYTYRVIGHSGFFRSPSGDRVFLELVERTSIDPRVTLGALAVSFKCIVPGRVTVSMTNSRGGTFMTVRIGRELYATAAVRPNDDFTFRVSKRCRLD